MFEFIEAHKLIDGFVPPAIPDDSETVPNLRGETPSDADFKWGRQINLSGYKGAFGKLITEWPLPEKTQSK